MRQQGKVKWFNAEKGYGFIAKDKGGKDVFIHMSALRAVGIESLDENQKIEFFLLSLFELLIEL